MATPRIPTAVAFLRLFHGTQSCFCACREPPAVRALPIEPARFVLWRCSHAGADTMKAAVTVWDGRVSPVFDVSREVLLLNVEHGVVVARSHESIEVPSAVGKVERLVDVGVDTLICGAISEPVQHELRLRRIKVISFVAGEIDEVVEGFLAGTLPTPRFSMPGCCRRQNGARGGREGGNGEGRRGRRGCGRNQRP